LNSWITLYIMNVLVMFLQSVNRKYLSIICVFNSYHHQYFSVCQYTGLSLPYLNLFQVFFVSIVNEIVLLMFLFVISVQESCQFLYVEFLYYSFIAHLF
jgi:hypothetical protein